MTNNAENDTINRLIGDAIHNQRKHLNWSQQRLASQAGMSQASIAYIESGQQNISIVKLCRIAAALQCELQDVLPMLKLNDGTRIPPLPFDEG